MKKSDEIADPNSCWNRARNGERVFVLLERDLATPDTVRDWAARRIWLGKNEPQDAQIVEALHAADLMEQTRVEGEARPDARPQS